ncbi:MAG TPA: hypothetical protein PKX92_02720 [Edaphocola sp.]|nr:hypothetical protein [Edaphocola sp.]
MKNLLIALSFLLLIVGCTKMNNAPLKSGQSRFSFSVSGATSGQFNSDDLMSTVSSNGTYLNVNASKVNTSTFQTEMVLMLMPANATVGKYEFANMSSSEQFPTMSYTKESTGWAAAPGENDFTVEVTNVSDGTVEGKLYGKLKNETDNTEISIDGTFKYKL